MKAINKMVRDMIYESGHSQAEIAKATNITEPTISRYCRGARVPSAEAFFKIANACGYKVSVNRPSEDRKFALRIFSRGLEETLTADETRRYIDTITAALSK